MISGQRFRAAFSEPIVHFLIAGLLLFGFFAVRGETVDPQSRTITISKSHVERLVSSFAQTWQRPPTQNEIDGLVRDYIKEEVYYREGVRIGLDQDDLIIRRRVRSKMEFLASSEAENARPDDGSLQAILDKNPQKYAADTRYSFDQIYLSVSDDAAGRARAKQIFASLDAGAKWDRLGDDISLPRVVENAGRSAIARDFGDEFAATLGEAKTGKWYGPVVSGFGLHLVRIRSVQAGAKPRLADIRQTIENDWRAATIQAREAKAYQMLLDSYTIEIAKP